MKIIKSKIKSIFLLCVALVMLFSSQPLVFANESPESILESFHMSTTGEEALNYLTGDLESQFSTLDEEKQIKKLEVS